MRPYTRTSHGSTLPNGNGRGATSRAHYTRTPAYSDALPNGNPPCRGAWHAPSPVDAGLKTGHNFYYQVIYTSRNRKD